LGGKHRKGKGEGEWKRREGREGIMTFRFCGNSLAGNKRQQSDIFAMSCSDGTFLLVQKRSGSIEKKVDAHKGAVISIRWLMTPPPPPPPPVLPPCRRP
jgi:hypothetical protein